jgi:hypothetical protein
MGFQSNRQSTNVMHRCPTCDSILVQPVNWHEQDDGYWNAELRCPECERRGWDSYTRAEIDCYAAELNCGGRELIEDLRALTHANMEDEADRFAAALASDSILPEDFNAGGGLPDAPTHYPPSSTA